MWQAEGAAGAKAPGADRSHCVQEPTVWQVGEGGGQWGM